MAFKCLLCCPVEGKGDYQKSCHEIICVYISVYVHKPGRIYDEILTVAHSSQWDHRWFLLDVFFCTFQIFCSENILLCNKKQIINVIFKRRLYCWKLKSKHWKAWTDRLTGYGFQVPHSDPLPLKPRDTQDGLQSHYTVDLLRRFFLITCETFSQILLLSRLVVKH